MRCGANRIAWSACAILSCAANKTWVPGKPGHTLRCAQRNRKMLEARGEKGAMTDSGNGLQPHEVKIRVHDGMEIALALYRPEGEGPFPVLLAASPYRYDNNSLPAGPQFLWRETGPIEFYVAQGYVYANMDVRGSGKSGGEFRLLDRAEQKDLYDVIEWLGHQPWSNGKVGGIGQS